MAHDRTAATRRSGTASWLSRLLLVGVLGALVGVPALLLAQVEFGLLTALGLPRRLAFGAVAMVPGFALGGLSLLAMLAPD
jgi:hypothetical protein